jgi:RNA polymerase sigma-70 factor (ECF subfamily)
MGNTDKSLIEAHLRGDKTAFRELVQRHGGSLLGYLVHMTGNRDQAEDIFQETFKRVHEKADTFAGDHFRNWLFAIATHLAIDSLRRRKRTRFASLNQSIDCGDDDCRDLSTLAVVEDTCDPVDEAAKSEQKAKVRQAIDSLPAKQRAALVLAYYQQLSYSQVAQVLGCSVGTVKTQMYRALRRLADKLPESLGAVK